MTGFPVYYWRYKQPCAAWFCIEADARAFVERGHDYGELGSTTFEPEAGVEYDDQGHLMCLAENCPGFGDDG